MEVVSVRLSAIYVSSLKIGDGIQLKFYAIVLC